MNKVPNRREEQQQWIRRLCSALDTTPTDLAKSAGLAASTLNRFVNQNPKHLLKTSTLLSVATAFVQRAEKIATTQVHGEVESARRRQLLDTLAEARQFLGEFGENTPKLNNIDLSDRIGRQYPLEKFSPAEQGEVDLPVLGNARGGTDGVFFDNGTVQEYIPRPGALKGVQNAYAVYVVGESMEPRYFHGEVVHVNPNRPPKAGDFVVIELHDGQGFVKRLKRVGGGKVVVSQYSPAKDVTLKREDVKNIHVIVSSAVTR